VILSKSAKYALRASLCLAEAGGDRPMPVDEIADRLVVPRNYLSKILHVLARTDVLASTRGPGGGFQLARPPHDLALVDVVRHFDDLSDDTTCLLGPDRCCEVDPCHAHERWAEVRSAITDFLADTKLSDLSSPELLLSVDVVEKVPMP